MFDGLEKNARKYGHKLISASASEGTIGREHLLQLLDIVEQSEFIYILETNGMTLGADPALCEQLARYRRLHVRVSIKGASPEEYHELRCSPDSYWLPYRAMKNLIDAGVSCNACLMASFTTDEGIENVKRELAKIHPGILKCRGRDHHALSEVAERLEKYGSNPGGQSDSKLEEGRMKAFFCQ